MMGDKIAFVVAEPSQKYMQTIYFTDGRIATINPTTGDVAYAAWLPTEQAIDRRIQEQKENQSKSW